MKLDSLKEALSNRKLATPTRVWFEIGVPFVARNGLQSSKSKDPKLESDRFIMRLPLNESRYCTFRPPSQKN